MLLTYFVKIQRRPSVTWLLCQKQLWLHACQTIMHNLQLFSLQDSLKPTRVKHFGYALNSWSSWKLQKTVWCNMRRRQLHVSRGKALSRSNRSPSNLLICLFKSDFQNFLTRKMNRWFVRLVYVQWVLRMLWWLWRGRKNIVGSCCPNSISDFFCYQQFRIQIKSTKRWEWVLQI